MTSNLQQIKNYAARVILRLRKSSNITTHLKSLHWLPVKGRSTYKIACSATTATAVLHHHMSLTCCRKSHHTPATLVPAHTSCLFSIDLHTVRQHLVITHFLLPLLQSATLFHMMSGVSFEDILASLSLQRLNFLFDHCTYVHGLALSLLCRWPFLKNALMCIYI